MSDQKFKVEVVADKAISDIKKLTKEFQKLDKSGGKVDTSTQKLTKRFGSLKTAIGGVIAGGAFLGFMGKVISATKTQERALSLLESQLRNTGNAVGYSTQQLAEYASELQNVSIYGDEKIMESQAALLSFSNIQGQVFKDAIRLSLDFATVMDMDLQGSIRAMGKALNDPIKGLTALGRGGTQFSASQEELIKHLAKTGRVADAQRVILKELEAQYGGASAAAVNNFGGALSKLQNAFADLFEAKGGLKDAQTSLQELTAILQDPDTVTAVDSLTSAMIKLVGWVAKGSVWFNKLGKGIGYAAAESGLFGNKLQLTNNELKKSKTALEQATLQVETLQKQIDTKKDLGQPFQHLESALERSKERVASLTRTVQMYTPVAGEMRGSTIAMADAIGEAGIKTGELGDSFEDLPPKINAVLTPLEQFVANLKAQQADLDLLPDKLFVLHSMYDDGVISLELMVAGIERLTGANEGLVTSTQEVVEEYDDMDRAMDLIIAEFDKLDEAEARSIAGLEEITEKSETLSTALGVSLASSADSMAQHFVDATILQKTSFGNMTKAILADIAKMIAKMLIMKAMGGLFGAAGGGTGAGILGGLFKKEKGDAFNNGSVIPFASGGVVDHPTFFPMAKGTGLMGEAGPEAILPLKRDKQGKLGVGGGSTKTINMPVSIVLQGVTDVRSFNENKDQLANSMQGQLAYANRNL